MAEQFVQELRTAEHLTPAVFEAVDSERGFEVRTPRIPGLQYRDFDDLD